MYAITLPRSSLFFCKKPGIGPLLRSCNVHLSTPDPERGVVLRTNINTNFFVLNFCTYIKYIGANSYLQLQANQRCIPFPVASAFEGRQCEASHQEFPRSLPHLGVLGANVIETRTQDERLKTRLLSCSRTTNNIHMLSGNVKEQTK